MSLLETKALSCSVQINSYQGLRPKKKRILTDVSFQIEEGTTLGLLGGSGSGKSTLARCLVGLQMLDGGEMNYRGINLFPHSKNRRLVPLEIQMLFQASSASLNPMMTVRECLNEAVTAEDSFAEKRAGTMTPEELTASVGLPAEVLDQVPTQLSGGQRQRIAIARAFAVQPKLLVLDEPTSALDAITQIQVLALLKQLQAEQGFSILFITHDIQAAFMVCDRIAILHEGKIVEEDSVEQLAFAQSHPYTQQLFSESKISF